MIAADSGLRSEPPAITGRCWGSPGFVSDPALMDSWWSTRGRVLARDKVPVRENWVGLCLDCTFGQRLPLAHVRPVDGCCAQKQ